MKYSKIPIKIPPELFTWTLYETYAKEAGLKPLWGYYQRYTEDKHESERNAFMEYVWDNYGAVFPKDTEDSTYFWVIRVQFFSWVCAYNKKTANQIAATLWYLDIVAHNSINPDKFPKPNYKTERERDLYWFALTIKAEQEFTNGIITNNPAYTAHVNNRLQNSVTLNKVLTKYFQDHAEETESVPESC